MGPKYRVPQQNTVTKRNNQPNPAVCAPVQHPALIRTNVFKTMANTREVVDFLTGGHENQPNLSLVIELHLLRRCELGFQGECVMSRDSVAF